MTRSVAFCGEDDIRVERALHRAVLPAQDADGGAWEQAARGSSTIRRPPMAQPESCPPSGAARAGPTPFGRCSTYLNRDTRPSRAGTVTGPLTPRWRLSYY